MKRLSSFGSPALRDREDCEALWQALSDGLLTAVSSDHCGIDVAELKQAGRNDFTQIPNGSPAPAIDCIWCGPKVYARES